MNQIDKKFIFWFINRLKNKHKENPEILNQFEAIVSNHLFVKKSVPKDMVDNICKKHYPDFDIERADDFALGYTEKDRDHMRNMIVDIINELAKT
jgi:uncharacterized linocin/CFP29 family protein